MDYWLHIDDYLEHNKGFDADAILPNIPLDFNSDHMMPLHMYYHFSENLLSLPTYFTQKFGVLNTKGHIIVPFEYDFISSFHQDYAYFEQDERIGFLDKFGKIIIPPVYDSTMGNGKNCFVVEQNNHWICLNRQNECIFEFESWVRNPSYFIGEFSVVLDENRERPLIINKKHEIVIDPIKYGVHPVNCEGWYDYFEVRSKGLLGFMDKELNFVIPCQFKNSYFDPIKKQLLVSKENIIDRMFYINQQGEIIGEFIIDR